MMAAAEEVDQDGWAFDFEMVDASGDVIYNANGEPSLEGDGGQNMINIDFLLEDEEETKEERVEERTMPPFFEEEVRTAASTNLLQPLCEEPSCRQKATFSFGRKQAPVRCKRHRFPGMK